MSAYLPSSDDLIKAIDEFNQKTEATGIYDLSQIQQTWLTTAEKQKYQLVKNPKLNKAINGFRPNTINFVVAKSGFGKSNFMINLAKDFATELQPDGNVQPVLFFSCEMEEENILPRFLANIFNQTINQVGDIKRKFLAKTTSQEEKERLKNELSYLTSLVPLEISYEKNIDMIIARVQKEALPKEDQKDGYVKHVMIDHFFELETTQQFNNDREKEIYIINQLQLSAQRDNVCYTIATQFVKGSEKGLDFGNRDMDSMRGAGEVRNKATNILYIYETKEQNDVNQNKTDWDAPDSITLRVLKARNGYEGKTIEFKYYRNKAKFVEQDDFYKPFHVNLND